jgi:hypothetical protein
MSLSTFIKLHYIGSLILMTLIMSMVEKKMILNDNGRNPRDYEKIFKLFFFHSTQALIMSALRILNYSQNNVNRIDGKIKQTSFSDLSSRAVKYTTTNHHNLTMKTINNLCLYVVLFHRRRRKRT